MKVCRNLLTLDMISRLRVIWNDFHATVFIVYPIEDYSFQVLNPGVFSITLQGEETVEGELIFMPTEVAAYDFELPTIINHTGAPTPAPTPFPPTPAPSNKNSLQHIINPKPQPYSVVTPRKHVVATALRQPLQLSTNKIEMFAPASFYDSSIQTGQMQSKVWFLHSCK